ncbi:MAG: hypothetical protein ABIQ88_12895 [Chitinophagaceae bacterium]
MRKKTVRLAIVLSLLCIAGGAIFVYRMYNKPHRSAATETVVVLTAGQLAAAYELDEAGANKKYLGNAVQVSGTVSELSFNQQNKQVLILTGTGMSAVQCSLLEDKAGVKKGDSVIIKGFCSGFLTDVIMDRCIVAKQ